METKNQIAQPVTDTNIEQASSVPGAISEQVTSEKPLSQKERLARIESQLAEADKNFKVIGDMMVKLQPVLNLAMQLEERQKAYNEQRAAAQNSDSPPAAKQGFLPAGLDLNSLLGVLGPILGQAGASSNPMVEKLMEKVVEAGLAQMTAGTNLLGAVQKKILMDIGTKIASDTTASIQ